MSTNTDDTPQSGLSLHERLLAAGWEYDPTQDRYRTPTGGAWLALHDIAAQGLLAAAERVRQRDPRRQHTSDERTKGPQ